MAPTTDGDPAERPARPSRRRNEEGRGPSMLADFEARAQATRSDFEHRAAEARQEFEDRARATKRQFDETQEKIRARTGRNLLAAVGIGVLLGGTFLVSLIIWPPLFIVFGGALIGFTSFELATALRHAGRLVPRVVSTVLGLAVAVVAFFFHVEGLWLATIAAVLLVSLWRLGELLLPSHRVSGRDLALDLGAGVLIQLYVTFLAGFYLVLTGIEGGQWWTLASILIVVVTDIGAYAAGLSFGRHKMAPTISPGKTWEGFAGSVLVAIIAGVLVAWLMLGLPWWFGVPMGIVFALVGTVGDLTESLIKRDLGVKDISSWLPGHGGFLDRLDSILPAGAVAYAMFLIAQTLQLTP
ncbi:MAG: phosphatidate cytidylyltransferase [Actinomycetales bacterium]|nr:phosphatidate cytidylyltransferase [Actinomycetales bacterium]